MNQSSDITVVGEQPETKPASIQDGRLRVQLKHPVVQRFKTADGSMRDERVTELLLRRITGADVRIIANMGDKQGDITATLIDRLAGKAIFDQLDMDDIVQVSEALNGFLPTGLKIGE